MGEVTKVFCTKCQQDARIVKVERFHALGYYTLHLQCHNETFAISMEDPLPQPAVKL